jgi:hypothetical protein
MRSCAERDGPSTASVRNACGDLRASRGPHRASASGAVSTRVGAVPAERPNHVWALDFRFDETADQRRLKLLDVVDERTREAVAMRVGRSCDTDQVVAVIESLVATRERHLRMDNGPSSWPGRCGLVPVGRNGPGPPLNPAVRTSSPAFSRGRSLSKHGGPSPTPTDPTPPSRHDPRRVRQATDHQPASAPVAAGPVNGVPSVEL